MKEPGGWHAVALLFGLAAAIATWLAWFRLEMSADGFSSRTPFGRARHVLFSEVTGVQVSAKGPASGAALGVIVKLTDGSSMRVNFKVFPKRAGDLLMGRFRLGASLRDYADAIVNKVLVQMCRRGAAQRISFLIRRFSVKYFAVATAFVLSGCASYVTPGGPVRLEAINRSDIAEVASRKPAANLPATIAVIRVQAPQYRSYTSDAIGKGNFSVVPTQELLSEEQLKSISRWPSVTAVVPISRLLLPPVLNSIDDLRLAAAKLQADVVLVYTVDTTFRVQGRAYGPLSVISLGLAPDRDAYITSTASAIFTDVRTGYTYGVAESTAKAAGLTNAWGSRDTIDRKRLEAEKQAFENLLLESAKTWKGIADRAR
jgi:hypothetical protein